MNEVHGVNIDELLEDRLSEKNPQWMVVRKTDKKAIRWYGGTVLFGSLAAVKGSITLFVKREYTYDANNGLMRRPDEQLNDIKSKILELVDFIQI